MQAILISAAAFNSETLGAGFEEFVLGDEVGGDLEGSSISSWRDSGRVAIGESTFVLVVEGA